MKKIWCAAALLAVSLPSFAQWTTSGSVTSTTNSIGIGTTAPNGKLSVAPSLTGSDATAATSLIVGNSTATLPNTAGAYLYPFEIHHLNAGGHSGKLQIATYRRFAAASGSEWQGAGYRLQTQYDGTGNLGQNAYLEIGESDPIYPGNGFISLGTGGVDRLSIGANGNIGINTTNPSVHSGYSGISTNNATNGGFIDFLKGGVLEGYICGDAGGLQLYAPSGNATHLWAGGTERLTILANGNVGIGNSMPTLPLQVGGAGSLTGNFYFGGVTATSMLSTDQGGTIELGNSTATSSPYVDLHYGGQSTAQDYNVRLWNNGNNKFQIITQSSGAVFTINQGSVGIGTASPDQLLTVNGTIHAKQVNVDVNVPAPDYVFEKRYKLRSLEEVDRYVTAYKHLPGVPSAKEMADKGMDMTAMNLKLLQKVEELTLYMVELKKENQKQHTLLSKQNKIINALQKDIVMLQSPGTHKQGK